MRKLEKIVASCFVISVGFSVVGLAFLTRLGNNHPENVKTYKITRHAFLHKFADKNNDGIISDNEEEKTYGDLLKQNGAKIYSNGSIINKDGKNIVNEYGLVLYPEILIGWMKNYKPTSEDNLK